MTVFVPDPVLLESPRGRPWPSLPSRRPAPAGGPSRTADVVLVGSGPAGLAVGSALWHHGVRDLVMLDRDAPTPSGPPGEAPAPRPDGRTTPSVGARFFRRVDRLGQRVLRSPYEHHPGVEGYRDRELLDFARLHWGRLTPTERGEIRMAQSGHRSVVPVDVFEAYCTHLASTHGLADRTWRAEVRTVRPAEHGVRVLTDAGEITARFVVLCTGEERREAPPTWWGGGPPPAGVRYWDDPAPSEAAGQVVVVGAGLSAAHRVAAALEAGSHVDWVFRAQQERYQCADVDASFFRPEGRARFGHGERSARRAMLAQHRRASVMFEFRPPFERAEERGRLVVHRGRTVSRVFTGTVGLDDGRTVRGDRVELALGTLPTGITDGAHLLEKALALGEDGWPDLEPRTLAYTRAPRVLSVGAPTAVELGPAARNIDGHRVATARVAAAVAEGLRRGAPIVEDTLVGVGG